MSSMISLTFACSICGYEIRGEYEEEDFDYPVFCPKCGRQNQLPPRTATPVQKPEVTPQTIPTVEITTRTTEQPAAASEAAVPHVAKTIAPPSPTPISQPPAVTMASVAVEPPPRPTVAASPAPAIPATAPPSSGRIAWRFRPVAGSRPIVPLRNCVALDEQNRLIAALGPEVYALVPDATGCEVAWKFAAADHIPGSPVVGPGGVVFVHSSDGLLHALDANGASLRTPAKVGPALGWATPLVDDAGRVWVSPATGGLVRVDESGQTSARPFWRHPSRLDCTGAILNDVLYIGSEDQYVHAVNLQADRGRDLWNLQDKVGLTGWYINSAITVDGDSRIIAVSRDDVMYALNLDGSVAWTTPLGGRAMGSPVIADNGAIILGLTTAGRTADSQSGRLIAVQNKSGQLAWKLDFDAPVEATPVVGDAGEVYVGDNSGRIHAVTIQGRRVWSELTGAPVRSAGTILPIGQVVFGADDGSLVAVRCTSKSVAGGWPKLLSTVSNRPSTHQV